MRNRLDLISSHILLEQKRPQEAVKEKPVVPPDTQLHTPSVVTEWNTSQEKLFYFCLFFMLFSLFFSSLTELWIGLIQWFKHKSKAKSKAQCTDTILLDVSLDL